MADPKKKEEAKVEAGVVAGLQCYQLTQKHYRNGVMYEPGQKVAVRDEKPGASWKPLPFDESVPIITREAAPDKAGPPAAGPVQVLGRPSDRAP